MEKVKEIIGKVNTLRKKNSRRFCLFTALCILIFVILAGIVSVAMIKKDQNKYEQSIKDTQGWSNAVQIGQMEETNEHENNIESEIPYNEEQNNSNETPDAKYSNEFAFNLINKVLAQSEENMTISPMSIEMAIAMLYNGAEGETFNEINKTLGLADYSLQELNDENQAIYEYLTRKEYEYGSEVYIANSLWLDEKYNFEQDYIDVIGKYYQGKVDDINFQNQDDIDLINNWILNQTNGKITDVLTPESISTETILTLVNSIYFKSPWVHPFDESNTKQEAFYLNDGSKMTVSMMNQEIPYANYYENESLQIVSLSYGSQEMYILLPREDVTTDNIINQLTESNWNSWVASMDQLKGNIAFPKFRITPETLELNTTLINLGIQSVFNPQKSNLSNLNREVYQTGEQLYITEVLHKTYIEVNEKGTEASATTAMVGDVTGVLDFFEFKADRPFIYLIVDNKTEAILFAGVIYEPKYN